MNHAVKVSCAEGADGFSCQVTVGEDAAATNHDVSVDAVTLARLAPGASDPTELVAASFEYLLAREPRESIMRSFDLPIISRYFEDYEDDIRS